MATTDKKSAPLLEVENLSVSFRMYDRGLKQKNIEVISNLNLQINTGEILAIIGSSGSGKSLLAHAVLGILPTNSTVTGLMRFDGQELTPSLQKKIRGKAMTLVPQSVAFLNPLMKLGKQVQGKYGTREQQQKVFRRFDLDETASEKYPFQLSGGMARRALVSTAVISSAKLIIADEPTPGLSPESAQETMDVFRELADEGRGVIIITHDIDLAFRVADNVAVLYNGTTVELTASKNFLAGGAGLKHPYSLALWEALPQNRFNAITSEELKNITSKGDT